MNAGVLVISTVCLGMLSSLGPVPAQTTWYVDASATGPGNGTQASPFPTIQAGINAASHSDTVLVLPGTYFEYAISFLGKAITVTSLQGPGSTTVNAQQGDSVVRFSSGEGCASVLEGLTLTNGRGPDGWYPEGAGGGIDIVNASPTIRRCMIEYNTGGSGWHGDPWMSAQPGGAGGASCLGYAASPLLEHCVLRGNVGGAGGHGMSGYYATSCCCVWAEPGQPGGAGAVRGAPTLVNCLLVGNLGGGGGGGGSGGSGGPAPLCSSSGASGGAGGPGGLLALGGAFLVGTTLAGNQGGLGGPGGVQGGAAGAQGEGAIAGLATGANLIIWGNQPATGTVPQVTHSLLWTASSGTGNITGDPLFVDPINGDYHILPTSPCVDAGDINAPSLPAFDIDGDPRIFHGIPDMGADETVLALLWEQAGGPGTPLTLSNYNLTIGNEYHNIFSLDLCPGGPGSGPYLGMCLTTMPNYFFILDQLQAPLGTPLFHFSAPSSYVNWGPYQIPPITVDGILYDFTGGLIGAVSPVTRIVVQ